MHSHEIFFTLLKTCQNSHFRIKNVEMWLFRPTKHYTGWIRKKILAEKGNMQYKKLEIDLENF